MIAQVFPSLRVLDRARSQLAYLRLPGFGEPPGTGFESLAPGFETYDAFLAARYEAEGFLVNATDADTAVEAVQRIRRDPSQCLKPVFLLHEAGPLAADLADGQVRSVEKAESLLAEFCRHAGPVAELRPATESTVLLRYLSVRPGKVLKPHRDWRDPQIYSYPLATLLMPGLSRHPQALDMLRERGLLEPDDLLDRLRLCPECRNAQIGFIDVCPECHGLKIAEQPFLHCFTCGFVGPQPEFVTGGAMRCPRCQESLRHIGVDYDRALEHWQCATCRHLFEDPEIKARCGICLWSGPTERLIARSVETLRLTEAGRRAALEGAAPAARLSGPARYVAPADFPEILDFHIRLSARATPTTRECRERHLPRRQRPRCAGHRSALPHPPPSARAGGKPGRAHDRGRGQPGARDELAERTAHPRVATRGAVPPRMGGGVASRGRLRVVRSERNAHGPCREIDPMILDRAPPAASPPSRPRWRR